MCSTGPIPRSSLAATPCQNPQRLASQEPRKLGSAGPWTKEVDSGGRTSHFDIQNRNWPSQILPPRRKPPSLGLTGCTSDMPCRSPWRVVGQDRGDHKGLRYVPEKPDHNRGPGSELRMMDNAHRPRRYIGTKPIGEGFDTSVPVAKNRPAT